MENSHNTTDLNSKANLSLININNSDIQSNNAQSKYLLTYNTPFNDNNILNSIRRSNKDTNQKDIDINKYLVDDQNNEDRNSDEIKKGPNNYKYEQTSYNHINNRTINNNIYNDINNHSYNNNFIKNSRDIKSKNLNYDPLHYYSSNVENYDYALLDFYHTEHSSMNASDYKIMSEIQTKRLKKAKLSRDARLKKKEYVISLEKEVEDLKRKISNLSKIKENCINSNDDDNINFKKLIPTLNSQIKKNKEEQILELSKKFVSDPTDRLKKADYYFDRINDCILPGQQVKFLLWLTNQSEEFYESNGLWEDILKQFNLTKEQMQIAKIKRKRLKKDRKNVDEVIKLINKSRNEVKGHLRDLSDLANNIRNILTPEQMVKFYLWTVSADSREVVRRIDLDDKNIF